MSETILIIIIKIALQSTTKNKQGDVVTGS